MAGGTNKLSDTSLRKMLEEKAPETASMLMAMG